MFANKTRCGNSRTYWMSEYVIVCTYYACVAPATLLARTYVGLRNPTHCIYDSVQLFSREKNRKQIGDSYYAYTYMYMFGHMHFHVYGILQ